MRVSTTTIEEDQAAAAELTMPPRDGVSSESPHHTGRQDRSDQLAYQSRRSESTGRSSRRTRNRSLSSSRSRRNNKKGTEFLGSRLLGGFYSSRRKTKSEISREESGKSNASASAWNLASNTSFDTSPRLPAKRGSLDNTSTTSQDDSPLSPPRRGSDTSPRRPDSTPLRRGSDTAPRRPKRVSLDNNASFTSIHAPLQDINVSPQKNGKPIRAAPIRPQDIHVTPTSLVPDKSSQQEVYEAQSDGDIDDSTSVRTHSAGDGSVISAASAPAPNTQERITPQRSRSDQEAPISPRKSAVFQKSLNVRRQESQRSFGSFSPSQSKQRSAASKDRWRQGSNRSLGGHSAVSQKSYGSRDSCRSMMSCQSHLDLSSKVQTLLEMASDVVNSNFLEHAAKSYQKTVHAAGSEIMDINIKMGDMQGDETAESRARRSSFHEDLRQIGIVIGMLRTKMAILYAEDGEYERAIDLCKGASQVHRHQPALKSAQRNLDGVDQMAALMVLIIERLESGQTCLEDHKELLEKIDMHSQRTDFSIISDCETVFSTKEIVFEMVERVSAQDDESVVSHYDDDTLDLLSVHAAGQDKHDEAIKFLRDALQIHLVALGMKHPRTGEHLLRIAKMYRGRGNNRKNEELVLGQFHQTAAVLQRSNLGSRARGAVLNDIAVIHMRRKDFSEAIKFLLDAIHAYEEDAEEMESGRRPVSTLKAWRNLGDCYMRLDKFKSAEGAFTKALDIQRDSQTIQDAAKGLQIRALGVDKSLARQTNDASIADTLCQIGKARAAGGDHKRALEIYKEALGVINRTVAVQGKPDAELLAKRDQLTRTLYCIAEACNETEDFERALRMYKLSMKVRNSNGAEKKDTRMSSRLHCLKCMVGIGDLYVKTKEYERALKQYKEAHSYCLASRVKSTHPVALSIREKLKETEEARDFALTSCPESARLEKKADAEIERGALDDAIESLKQLLANRTATLQELKDSGQDTSEQVYSIACLLQTFGFVFAKNGDDENAERAFKDASRLFRKGGGPALEDTRMDL